MRSRALGPVRVVSANERQPVIPNGVLGMLIFVIAEVMMFAGLISAFTIVRASAMVWPPPDQPRLPIEQTALNTAALLASGLMLFVARRRLSRDPSRARRALMASMLLGAFFVVMQGKEWLALLSDGLTLTSSTLGGFFYLIVGMHGLHAIAALAVLAVAWWRMRKGWMGPGVIAPAEVFWYFVVGVWPVLYMRVYL